jgi:hypothetical protein
MKWKEMIITSIVVIILIGGYCSLFALILLFSNTPVVNLLIITIVTVFFGSIGLLIVSGTRFIKRNPPLIASEAKDVAISPLDCFTWGHIAFGVLSFLVDLFFIVFLSLETGFLLWWSIILTLILIGTSWDIIENTLFIEIGIKFENRRDSTINVFSDVFFVCVGGLLLLGIYLLTGLIFYITVIAAIVILVICGILFVIRYRMVVKKREK